MICRDAQPLLSAERDGALTPTERAVLDEHVSCCAACRQDRAALAAAAQSWRAQSAAVSIPDPGVEWHALRQRLRTGDEKSTTTASSRSRRSPSLAWFAAPLGAAAALALAATFFFSPSPSPVTLAQNAASSAQATSVELPGESSSAMVYVDQESGWLVVWAVDDRTPRGM